MLAPIIKIPFDVDKEKFLDDFDYNRSISNLSYEDEVLKAAGLGAKSYFKITRSQDVSTPLLKELSENISKKYNCDARARYYWLKPKRQLWWHVDTGTQCSLNYVINGNPSKILIADEDLKGPPPKHYEEFTYSSALLNTTKYHTVPNNVNQERILLKISIFDKTYEEMAKYFM